MADLVSTLDVFPTVEHRGPAHRDRALEDCKAIRRSPQDTKRQLHTEDTTCNHPRLHGREDCSASRPQSPSPLPVAISTESQMYERCRCRLVDRPRSRTIRRNEADSPARLPDSDTWSYIRASNSRFHQRQGPPCAALHAEHTDPHWHSRLSLLSEASSS